jgi:hypothetical protein
MIGMYYGSMEEGNAYLVRKKYTREIVEVRVVKKTKYCFQFDWGDGDPKWFYQYDMNEWDIVEDLGRDLNKQRVDKIDDIFG